MCYKSLFLLKLLAEEDRKVRLFRHLGIFVYLRTALGSREKNRALYLFFWAVLFLISTTRLPQRMATTFKTGRNQCNGKIHFKLRPMCVLFLKSRRLWYLIHLPRHEIACNTYC